MAVHGIACESVTPNSTGFKHTKLLPVEFDGVYLVVRTDAIPAPLTSGARSEACRQISPTGSAPMQTSPYPLTSVVLTLASTTFVTQSKASSAWVSSQSCLRASVS